MVIVAVDVPPEKVTIHRTVDIAPSGVLTGAVIVVSAVLLGEKVHVVPETRDQAHAVAVTPDDKATEAGVEVPDVGDPCVIAADVILSIGEVNVPV
jgi:hypothetical protein